MRQVSGEPPLVSVDPSVTAALEAAVAADPGNPALRIHLASLLVMGGDAARALEHAQAALATAPDDAEALAAARDAAQALGDHARAESYTRLLRSMDGGRAQEDFIADDPTRWALEDDAETLDDRFAIPESGPAGEFDDDGLLEAERPRVTLNDVGGLEEVKARLD